MGGQAMGYEKVTHNFPISTQVSVLSNQLGRREGEWGRRGRERGWGVTQAREERMGVCPRLKIGRCKLADTHFFPAEAKRWRTLG